MTRTSEMLIANMTASGHRLRDLLIEWTGCDPVTDPVFAWRNAARCESCRVTDSTAVMSFDGETFERLCFHCAVERQQ